MLLVVLSPAVSVSTSAAAWLAYIILLIQGLVLLLLFLVLAFKIAELAIRLVGQVPFDESRSARSGGLKGALRKYNNAPGGGGGHKARSGGAQRRREVEERRRRNLQRQGRMSPSEDTIGTHTRMLPGRPTHHSQQSRASSSVSSYADYSRPGPPMQQQPINFGGEDDGFIMSAMSTNNWGGSPGYVKPGAYSGLPAPQPHQQPILRAGPAWGDQVTVVPAPTVAQQPAMSTYSSPPKASSGFTRVGGGRASSSNPYQLANAATAAYPPYPASSADLYSPTTPTSGSMPGNPRRMSQSAIIEMASATDPSTSRPGPPSLPSSSTLLSNTVKPYPTQRRPSIVAVPKGFFGRFRSPKRKPSGDFSSDDDGSDSDDEGRRPARGWGLRFGGLGGKKPEAMPEEAEDDAAASGGGETGFVVTRKPRPRAAPTVSRDASQGTMASAGDPLQGQAQPPRVSVEAPSDGHGVDDEEDGVGRAA